MTHFAELRSNFDFQRNGLRNLESVTSISIIAAKSSGEIPQSRKQFAVPSLPQQYPIAIAHQQHNAAHIDRIAPWSHLRNALDPSSRAGNANPMQRTFVAARILWRTDERTKLHLRLIDGAGIARF